MKRKSCLLVCLLMVWCGYALSSVENTAWVIVEGILLDGVIGPLPNEKYLGKVLRYSKDFVEYDEKRYPVKRIRKEVWTEEDLFVETRGTGSQGLTFKDFGYHGEKLIVIDYKAEAEYSADLNSFTPTDSLLFLINGNEMIMLCNTYYHLKRINK